MRVTPASSPMGPMSPMSTDMAASREWRLDHERQLGCWWRRRRRQRGGLGERGLTANRISALAFASSKQASSSVSQQWNRTEQHQAYRVVQRATWYQLRPKEPLFDFVFEGMVLGLVGRTYHNATPALSLSPRSFGHGDTICWQGYQHGCISASVWLGGALETMHDTY